MKIIEYKNNLEDKKFLEYIKGIEWGAAKLLYKVTSTNTINEKFGDDARIFYVKDNENIVGFFTIVNQDYIKLPEYDRFIAMLWVDPEYRGRGLSREFVKYAEEISGVKTIHLLTRHKGLYEKMGYKLIKEFKDEFHDMDYLYEKEL